MQTIGAKYVLIEKRLKEGRIKSLSEIFEIVPYEVIAVDISISIQGFKSMIEMPGTFTAGVVLKLCKLFHDNDRKLLKLISKELEEGNAEIMKTKRCQLNSI